MVQDHLGVRFTIQKIQNLWFRFWNLLFRGRLVEDATLGLSFWFRVWDLGF